MLEVLRCRSSALCFACLTGGSSSQHSNSPSRLLLRPLPSFRPDLQGPPNVSACISCCCHLLPPTHSLPSVASRFVSCATVLQLGRENAAASDTSLPLTPAFQLIALCLATSASSFLLPSSGGSLLTSGLDLCHSHPGILQSILSEALHLPSSP